MKHLSKFTLTLTLIFSTALLRNSSNENVYIQSATLNGKPFDRAWITQEEITQGGKLQFRMGPEPNKQWGVGNPPPSMSKK